MPLIRKKNIDNFTDYNADIHIKELTSRIVKASNFIAKKSKSYSQPYVVCNATIAKYIKNAINKKTESE